MTAALTVVAAGIGCALLRLLPVAAVARWRPAPSVERRLALVGPAVLAALAAPPLLGRSGEAAPLAPGLVAAVAAVVAVRRTGHPVAALAAGLPALWIATAVLA